MLAGTRTVYFVQVLGYDVCVPCLQEGSCSASKRGMPEEWMLDVQI